MEKAAEELRFVSQSLNRSEALLALTRDGPLKRTELERRLDASHRTVVRVVNTLDEAGFLRDSNGELRLSLFGSLVGNDLDDFVTATEVAIRFKPFLRNAPPALEFVDLDHLAGAELLVASESDPFAILDRILSLRSQATRIREIAPGVEQKSISQLADRVQRGDELDVEAVLPEQASESAESRSTYREDHRAAIASDAVDIYVHPEPISFFAGVLDDTVAIAVTEEGQPHALVLSEDVGLREQVESLVATYRDDATQKTV